MEVAVVKEQGEIYFAIGYITAIIVAVLTASGIFYGYWRRSTKALNKFMHRTHFRATFSSRSLRYFARKRSANVPVMKAL